MELWTQGIMTEANCKDRSRKPSACVQTHGTSQSAIHERKDGLLCIWFVSLLSYHTRLFPGPVVRIDVELTPKSENEA